MAHQSLSTVAPDATKQFKESLDIANTTRAETRKKEALSYLANQLSMKPPVNPVGTANILKKLLPLISYPSAPIRTELRKVFNALPKDNVETVIKQALLCIRAGLTNLSTEISNYAAETLDWLLDLAGDEVVNAPECWVKPLSDILLVIGWKRSKTKDGWSSASTSLTNLSPSAARARARHIAVLDKFLQIGFRPAESALYNRQQYWDNLYRIPRTHNPFGYLNLYGAPRSAEKMPYNDPQERLQIFHKVLFEDITNGMNDCKKEGGVIGRAASALEKTVNAAMVGFEPEPILSEEELLNLW